MKRITITIQDSQFEHLRIIANAKDNGRVSVTVRNILDEVFAIENKKVEKLLNSDIIPVKKTIKESKEEIKTFVRQRGEMNADDYV